MLAIEVLLPAGQPALIFPPENKSKFFGNLPGNLISY